MPPANILERGAWGRKTHRDGLGGWVRLGSITGTEQTNSRASVEAPGLA